MADGKKLEDIVSNLKSQFEETKGSFNNVLQRQLGTNESLKEMKAAQGHLNSEIDTLQKDIQKLGSNQRGQHDLMTDRLIQLKGQLVDFDRKLNEQNQSLLAIVDRQGKENDRVQLEHKRGHTLVQMLSLLKELRDSSVSYAFCSKGLTKLAMNGIVPGAFQSLDSMSKAEQIIAELKRKRDEIDDSSRFEAENFEIISQLLNEIKNEKQRHEYATKTFAMDHDSLTKKMSELTQEIKLIEVAQKGTQQKKGGNGIWILTVLCLVAGLGLLANPRERDLYELGQILIPLAVVFLVIGIILSIRRRAINFSIARKDKQVEKMKSDSAAIESRLLTLKENVQKEAESTQNLLPNYQEKIKNLRMRLKEEDFQIDINPDDLRSKSAIEIFDLLINKLAKLRSSWIAKHPEMERVINSTFL